MVSSMVSLMVVFVLVFRWCSSCCINEYKSMQYYWRVEEKHRHTQNTLTVRCLLPYQKCIQWMTVLASVWDRHSLTAALPPPWPQPSLPPCARAPTISHGWVHFLCWGEAKNIIIVALKNMQTLMRTRHTLHYIALQYSLHYSILTVFLHYNIFATLYFTSTRIHCYFYRSMHFFIGAHIFLFSHTNNTRIQAPKHFYLYPYQLSHC